MSRQRRQALYDQIRKRIGGKVEHIRQEMIRLGFWTEQPTDPPATRRTELRAERDAALETVLELVSEAALLGDLDALRRQAKTQRMAASRARREETKQAREAARAERAAQWKRRKAKEIIWLGEGFGADLGEREPNESALQRSGLPALNDAEAIARAMGINVGELRFLANGRRVSTTTHYQRFGIPKKTGGERLISAPMPRLKGAQRWILDEVLSRIPLHDAAHGFVPGRSIVTNAAPHVGKAIVINLDLKDFFPSVDFKRVRGLLRALGLSREAATILGLILTEPDTSEVSLDGQRYFVATGERRLPQGSPASPALTNILCRRLDRRLQGLAAAMGFVYTRYADDLTFSALDPRAPVQTLLAAVRGIVGDESFTLHPDKTRVMRAGRRQEVTGLVVNERLGIPRERVRQFRALLFQVERDGPAGKSWGAGRDVFASMFGFAGFVAMVDPSKGRPLVERVRALASAHGWGAAALAPPSAVSWTVPDQDAFEAACAEPALALERAKVERAAASAEAKTNRRARERSERPAVAEDRGAVRRERRQTAEDSKGSEALDGVDTSIELKRILVPIGIGIGVLVLYLIFSSSGGQHAAGMGASCEQSEDCADGLICATPAAEGAARRAQCLVMCKSGTGCPGDWRCGSGVDHAGGMTSFISVCLPGAGLRGRVD